jgi:putative ABC transport system ATP-binding protein
MSRITVLEEEEAELPAPAELSGAFAVLRRGLRETPELRKGIGYTIVFAMVSGFGQLLVPILIQQILDKGFTGPTGFRPDFVFPACAAGGVAVVIVYFAGRASFARMVRASENSLFSLRVRVFNHIHKLSLAEQTARRKGAYVARVTADMDTLSEFMQWGGLSWIISSTLMLTTIVVMLIYSWQLTAITIIVISPLVLVLRQMQKGMLSAYDIVRTRVGETMSEVSESLMGVAVVRAYGVEEHIDRRVKTAIANQYRAQIHANRYMSAIFPIGDIFGALAVAAVLAMGASYGPRMGLTLGQVVAFLFLVSLFLQPMAEISETFDQTQTAIAGWRKILSVLDLPVEIKEPAPGVKLPPGALPVHVDDLSFAYREGGLVLRQVNAEIAAGSHIAVVGETGSGKTTFAKILCRLADPTAGAVVIGGVDLREVSAPSRREAIRMIPQDGFLFDNTIRENVRYGHEGAGDAEVKQAFADLGLAGWIDAMPQGLDTQVGERGEILSVGERQLVALVRAQLGAAGLLILDEATSNVDPETERNLNQAMHRLSEGRTTITIAHRLSTAEQADWVLVFDNGRVVERGTHDQLVAQGGVYAGLYDSWLGNTRRRRGAGEADQDLADLSEMEVSEPPVRS